MFYSIYRLYSVLSTILLGGGAPYSPPVSGPGASKRRGNTPLRPWANRECPHSNATSRNDGLVSGRRPEASFLPGDPCCGTLPGTLGARGVPFRFDRELNKSRLHPQGCILAHLECRDLEEMEPRRPGRSRAGSSHGEARAEPPSEAAVPDPHALATGVHLATRRPTRRRGRICEMEDSGAASTAVDRFPLTRGAGGSTLAYTVCRSRDSPPPSRFCTHLLPCTFA
jgi:hypothetical protein